MRLDLSTELTGKKIRKSRFGVAFPFHGECFGSEGLGENRMSFDADSGAVGNRPIFVDAFVDAFHSFAFVLSFQRLAAV
jgi:hypothetical protein